MYVIEYLCNCSFTMVWLMRREKNGYIKRAMKSINKKRNNCLYHCGWIRVQTKSLNSAKAMSFNEKKTHKTISIVIYLVEWRHGLSVNFTKIVATTFYSSKHRPVKSDIIYQQSTSVQCHTLIQLYKKKKKNSRTPSMLGIWTQYVRVWGVRFY